MNIEVYSAQFSFTQKEMEEVLGEDFRIDPENGFFFEVDEEAIELEYVLNNLLKRNFPMNINHCVYVDTVEKNKSGNYVFNYCEF